MLTTLEPTATEDTKPIGEHEIEQPGTALSELAVSGDRRDRGGGARPQKTSPPFGGDMTERIEAHSQPSDCTIRRFKAAHLLIIIIMEVIQRE